MRYVSIQNIKLLSYSALLKNKLQTSMLLIHYTVLEVAKIYVLRGHFTQKLLGAQALELDHLGSNLTSITY